MQVIGKWVGNTTEGEINTKPHEIKKAGMTLYGEWSRHYVMGQTELLDTKYYKMKVKGEF